MKTKLPSFLTGKNELTGTLIFTAFFGIAFLNIYSPLSSTTWFGLNKSAFFIFTIGFISLSLILLIISRVIMHKTRYSLNIGYPGYIIWIICEILVITLFYTYVTAYHIRMSPPYFSIIFPKVLLYVSIILIVPYSISALYCGMNYRRNTLRIQDYSQVVSDDDNAPREMEMVHLSDNSGNLKLSVRLDNLYYIESQDNYIKVFYLNNNILKNYMLRCKLQTIEESFAGSPLIRCHRSYIVNSKKIRAVRREKNITLIDLDHPDISPIPVTRKHALPEEF